MKTIIESINSVFVNFSPELKFTMKQLITERSKMFGCARNVAVNAVFKIICHTIKNNFLCSLKYSLFYHIGSFCQGRYFCAVCSVLLVVILYPCCYNISFHEFGR